MFIKFRNNLLFFQTLLICLIPPSLILGPFLPDLLFSLSGFIFIFLIILEKKYFLLLNNKFFTFIILWSLYFIFSSLISNEVLLSLEGSLFYFRFGIGALSVVYLLEKNENFLNYFTTILLITLIVLIIHSYFQYFINISLVEFNSNYRLSGIFGEEKKLGSYILRIVPLFVFILIFRYNLKNQKNYIKFLLFLFLILAENLILLSAERNAILLSFIYIFFFMIILIKTKKVYFFLGPPIVFILLITFIKNDYLRFDDIKIDLLSEKKIIIHEQYTAHFLTALNIFYDKPILGSGAKTFRKLCDYDKYKIVWGSNYAVQTNDEIKDFKLYTGCSTHPHSTYLQLLSETGIIGFIPLMTIFLIMNYMIFKFFFGYKTILSFEAMPIFLLLYINIFPFSTSGNFFGNWLSIIIYLPIGFLLHALNKNNDNKFFS